ncbi:MAG: NYN domain-containing protein, partial [Anaerolineales bacterium]|nr:NYN domain-containing protein [Anaerolineales bacterium]
MDYEKLADVAVFFDFENIVFSLRNNYNINANFEDLMDKCKEFGRVVVAHSFADWNRHSPAMIPALMSNGFDPVYVPSFTMGNDGQTAIRKNAVDMYMAIDAMDILHNRKSVDTFILLTGDSDFLPLVNAIRREGRRVIAIGVDGSTSSHLAQAVDDFIFYSQFSEIPSANFKRRPRNIYEGLVEAINELQSRQRSSVLPNVKMMMAELMGGFDEKKHTDSQGRRFQKFKEFVQEGERRGMVKLVTTGTVNEVFLADDQRAIQARKEKPEAVKTSGQPKLDEAYELLAQAASKAIEENKSSRPSSIKGIMTSLHNGFNEKEIEVSGKKPFGRFGEFVKAAEEAGYVKVTGKGHSRRILPPKDEPETESEEQQTPAETSTSTDTKPVAQAEAQPQEPESEQEESKPVVVEAPQEQAQVQEP